MEAFTKLFQSNVSRQSLMRRSLELGSIRSDQHQHHDQTVFGSETLALSLFRTILYNDAAAAERALTVEPELLTNPINSSDDLVVHLAARMGNAKLVDSFLARSTDREYAYLVKLDGWGQTPLTYTTVLGSVKMAESLVTANGSLINTTSKDGKILLQTAAAHDNGPLVKWMVEYIHQGELEDNVCVSSLFLLIEKRMYVVAEKFLGKMTWEHTLEAIHRRGTTVLHHLTQQSPDKHWRHFFDEVWKRYQQLYNSRRIVELNVGGQDSKKKAVVASTSTSTTNENEQDSTPEPPRPSFMQLAVIADCNKWYSMAAKISLIVIVMMTPLFFSDIFSISPNITNRLMSNALPVTNVSYFEHFLEKKVLPSVRLFTMAASTVSVITFWLLVMLEFDKFSPKAVMLLTTAITTFMLAMEAFRKLFQSHISRQSSMRRSLELGSISSDQHQHHDQTVFGSETPALSLFRAILYNDTAAAERALTVEPELLTNPVNSSDDLIVHLATRMGNAKLVDSLLARSTDREYAYLVKLDGWGQTPLTYTAVLGSVKMAESLVTANGSLINTASKDGKILLQIAAAHNNGPLVKWMVEYIHQGELEDNVCVSSLFLLIEKRMYGMFFFCIQSENEQDSTPEPPRPSFMQLAVTAANVEFLTNVLSVLPELILSNESDVVTVSHSVSHRALGAHNLANLTGKTNQPYLIGLFVFIQAATMTFIRFFPKVKTRYDYGMLIFILTFCLISIYGFRPNEVVKLAQARLLTILLGVSTCLLVSILICPVRAGEDLHKFVVQNIHQLGHFLKVSCYLIHSCDSDARIEMMTRPSMINLNNILVDSKTMEETLANLAGWEPGHAWLSDFTLA
ncbi:hypothetical protein C2S51_000294 [Perilla frutescens var. frutescens]|nr:hypothetical protein C2S51_000294 [Perilla frutescens var. frutescens]